MSNVGEELFDKHLQLIGTSKDTNAIKCVDISDTNQRKIVQLDSLSQTLDTAKSFNNHVCTLWSVNYTSTVECLTQNNVSQVKYSHENEDYLKPIHVCVNDTGKERLEHCNKRVNSITINTTAGACHHISNGMQPIHQNLGDASRQDEVTSQTCEHHMIHDLKHHQSYNVNVQQSIENEIPQLTKPFLIEDNSYLINNSYSKQNTEETVSKVSKQHEDHEKVIVDQYKSVYDLEPHDPVFIDYCLHKYYRLNRKKWKKSSPKILKSLKKKYKSIRLLFHKDLEIMLKRVPERNIFATLGQVTKEKEKEEENNPCEERESLVDPRVKSLSKALESGKNGKTGIEKTFKSFTVQPTRLKKNRSSGRQSRKPKWSLDPDWHTKVPYSKLPKVKSKKNNYYANRSVKFSKLYDQSRVWKSSKSSISPIAETKDSGATSTSALISNTVNMSEMAALSKAVEHQRNQSKYSHTHHPNSKIMAESGQGQSQEYRSPGSMSDSATVDSAIVETYSHNQEQDRGVDVDCSGEFSIEICRESPVDSELMKNNNEVNVGITNFAANKDAHKVDPYDKRDCNINRNKHTAVCSEIFVKVPCEGSVKRLSYLASESLTVTSEIIPNLHNIEDDDYPNIDQTELSPPILSKETNDTPTIKDANNTLSKNIDSIISKEVIKISKEVDKEKTHETKLKEDNQIVVSEIDDYVIYEIVNDREAIQCNADEVSINANLSDMNSQKSARDVTIEGVCSNNSSDLSKIKIIDIQGNADHIMAEIENQCSNEVKSAEDDSRVFSGSDDTKRNTRIIDNMVNDALDSIETEDAKSETEGNVDYDSDTTENNQETEEMFNYSLDSNTLPTMPMQLNVKGDINIDHTENRAKSFGNEFVSFVLEKHSKTVEMCKEFHIPSSPAKYEKQNKHALKLSEQTVVTGSEEEKLCIEKTGETKSDENKYTRKCVDLNQEMSQNQEVRVKGDTEPGEGTQKPNSDPMDTQKEHREKEEVGVKGDTEPGEGTQKPNSGPMDTLKEHREKEEVGVKGDNKPGEGTQKPNSGPMDTPKEHREKRGRRSKSDTHVNTNKDLDVHHKGSQAQRQKRARFYSAQEKAMMDDTEERLMRDFPKHNWLFNKYSNTNSVDDIFKRKQKHEVYTAKGHVRRKRSLDNIKKHGSKDDALDLSPANTSRTSGEDKATVQATSGQKSASEEELQVHQPAVLPTAINTAGYGITDSSEKSIKFSTVSSGNDQINLDRGLGRLEKHEEVTTNYNLWLSPIKHSSQQSLYSHYDRGLVVTKLRNEPVKNSFEIMDSGSDLSHHHGNEVKDGYEKTETVKTGQETQAEDSIRNTQYKTNIVDCNENSLNQDETKGDNLNVGDFTKVKVNDTEESANEDKPETEDMPQCSLALDCAKYMNDEPVSNPIKCLEDTTISAASGKNSPIDLCLTKPELSNVTFRQRGNLPVQRVHPHVHKPPSSSLNPPYVDTPAGVYTSNSGGTTLVSMGSNNSSSLPSSTPLEDRSINSTQGVAEVNFVASVQASNTSQTSTTPDHIQEGMPEMIPDPRQMIATTTLPSCCDSRDGIEAETVTQEKSQIDINNTVDNSPTTASDPTTTINSPEAVHDNVKVKLGPCQALVKTSNQGIISGNPSMVIPVQPIVQSQSVTTPKPVVTVSHSVFVSQQSTSVSSSQRLSVTGSHPSLSYGQHLPPPPLLLHTSGIQDTANTLQADQNNRVQMNKGLSRNRLQKILPMPQLTKAVPQLSSSPIYQSSNAQQKSVLIDSYTGIVTAKSSSKTCHIASQNPNICTKNIISVSAISNNGSNKPRYEKDTDDIDNLDDINEEIKREMEALDAEIKRKEKEREEIKRKKIELLQKVKHSQTIKPVHIPSDKDINLADKEAQEKFCNIESVIENKESNVYIEEPNKETKVIDVEIDMMSGPKHERPAQLNRNDRYQTKCCVIEDEGSMESDGSDRDSPKLVVDEDKCGSDLENTDDHLVDDTRKVENDVSVSNQNKDKYTVDQAIDFSLKEKRVAKAVEPEDIVTVDDIEESVHVEDSSQKKEVSETVNLVDLSIQKDDINETNDKTMIQNQNIQNDFLDLSMKFENITNSHNNQTDNVNDKTVKTEAVQDSTTVENPKEQDKEENIDEETFISSLDLSKRKTYDKNFERDLKSHCYSVKSVDSVSSKVSKLNSSIHVSSVKPCVENLSKWNKPVENVSLSVRDITSPIITTDLANDALSALKSSTLCPPPPTTAAAAAADNGDHKGEAMEAINYCNKLPEVMDENTTIIKENEEKVDNVTIIIKDTEHSTDTQHVNTTHDQKRLDESHDKIAQSGKTIYATDTQSTHDDNDNPKTEVICTDLPHKSERLYESVLNIENVSKRERDNEPESQTLNTKRTKRYIELLPAHFKPQLKVQRRDKPLPAHQSKVDSREVLKKIDKIQMRLEHSQNIKNCPYICRKEPYRSYPKDWKKQPDRKESPPTAHNQEPFLIPGYLFVQSKRGWRKRKMFENVIRSSSHVPMLNRTDSAGKSGSHSTSVSVEAHHSNHSANKLQTDLLISPSKSKLTRNNYVTQNIPLSAHLNPALIARSSDISVTKVSHPPIASDRMPLDKKNYRLASENVIDLTAPVTEMLSRKRGTYDVHLTNTEFTIQQELSAALAKRQKLDSDEDMIHNHQTIHYSERTAQPNPLQLMSGNQNRSHPSSIIPQAQTAARRQCSRMMDQENARGNPGQIPPVQMRPHGERPTTGWYHQHPGATPSRPQDRIHPGAIQSSSIQAVSPNDPHYARSNMIQGSHGRNLYMEDRNNSDSSYINNTAAMSILQQPGAQGEMYVSQGTGIRQRPVPSPGVHVPPNEPALSMYPSVTSYYRDKRRVQPQLGSQNQAICGLDMTSVPDQRERQQTMSYQRQRSTIIVEGDSHRIQMSPNPALEGHQSFRQIPSPGSRYHQGQGLLSPSSPHTQGQLQRAMGHVSSPGYQQGQELMSPGSPCDTVPFQRPIGHSLVTGNQQGLITLSPGSPHGSSQQHQSIGQLSGTGQQHSANTALADSLHGPSQLVQLLQQKRPQLLTSELGSMTVEEKMKQVRAQFLKAQMERKQRQLQRKQMQHQHPNLDVPVSQIAPGHIINNHAPPQQHVVLHSQSMAPPKQPMAPPTQNMAPPSLHMVPRSQNMAPPSQHMVPHLQSMAPSSQHMAPPMQQMTPPQHSSGVSVQHMQRQEQNYKQRCCPVTQARDSSIHTASPVSTVSGLVFHPGQAHAGQRVTLTSPTDAPVSRTHNQTPTYGDYTPRVKQTSVVKSPPPNVTVSNPRHPTRSQHHPESGLQQSSPSSAQSYQDFVIKRSQRETTAHVIEIKQESPSPEAEQPLNHQQQILHQHQMQQLHNQNQQNSDHCQQDNSHIQLSNHQQEAYYSQQQQQIQTIRQVQHPMNEQRMQPHQHQHQMHQPQLRHKQPHPHQGQINQSYHSQSHPPQSHPRHQNQTQFHQRHQQPHQNQPLTHQIQMHKPQPHQNQPPPHQRVPHQQHVQANVILQNRDPTREVPRLQQVQGTCVMCGNRSMFLCSNCKKFWYCSPECQLKHWQTIHATECRGEV